MSSWLALYAVALVGITAMNLAFPRLFANVFGGLLPAENAESVRAPAGALPNVPRCASGIAYLDGLEPFNAYDYRLTQSQLVWHRLDGTEVGGFVFAEVTAFGSWVDESDHLVLGLDIAGQTLDIVLVPNPDEARGDAHKSQVSAMKALLDQLRGSGAKELLTASLDELKPRTMAQNQPDFQTHVE